jgi:A/G-specific adenine glycosylase
VGFQNRRGRALSTIAAEYESLPADRGDLRELERVGTYVADATLCFGLGKPLPIIDRNVRRVYRRLFPEAWSSEERDPRDIADALLPEESPREFNAALLDFGALVCKKNPECDECFASTYCPSSRATEG